MRSRPPGRGVTMVLPDATRLVHIGPHKTGTTAVQAAMWSARPAMLEQGVRHVGRSRNPSAAVRAVVEASSPYRTNQPPPMRHWDGLVREFRRASEPRVVVSSEFFAWAKPAIIRRIVDDLDAARIHIAVTFRPLARVIPSMWQQNIQQGQEHELDAWLRGILENRARPFWHLEQHDALAARWLDVVGPERMTGIVVDDKDHGAVMRAFEGLLGLSAGTLVPIKEQMNRSLTMAEAEAIRAFNVAYNAEGLPRHLHARVMRFGAAQIVKQRTPQPGEGTVLLPEWAAEPVAAIQEEVIAGIERLGIPIIGDLDVLRRGRDESREESPRVEGIPPDVVGAMGLALLGSTGALRGVGKEGGLFQFAEPAEVARVPTYQLLGTVAGRGYRSARRRSSSLLRRVLRPGAKRPSPHELAAADLAKARKD